MKLSFALSNLEVDTLALVVTFSRTRPWTNIEDGLHDNETASCEAATGEFESRDSHAPELDFTSSRQD